MQPLFGTVWEWGVGKTARSFVTSRVWRPSSVCFLVWMSCIQIFVWSLIFPFMRPPHVSAGPPLQASGDVRDRHQILWRGVHSPDHYNHSTREMWVFKLYSQMMHTHITTLKYFVCFCIKQGRVELNWVHITGKIIHIPAKNVLYTVLIYIFCRGSSR